MNKSILVSIVSIVLSLAVGSVCYAATGFLKGETSKDGMSKVCLYDVLGDIHALNVSSVSICPMSYQFDTIPDKPSEQIPQTYRNTTGFLKGEEVQGLSKICIYDVLGETQMLNVSSVAICPLSHQF